MKLEPGEYECDKCNGHGYDMRPNHYNCPKCNGTGKLDWIENIVGKKEQIFYDSTSCDGCNLVG